MVCSLDHLYQKYLGDCIYMYVFQIHVPPPKTVILWGEPGILHFKQAL